MATVARPRTPTVAARTRAATPTALPVLDRYLNRELSTLQFQERVLAQAEEETSPLLERTKFAAIFAGALDEFYQVRVAGLKRQVAAGATATSPDGRARDATIRNVTVFADAEVDRSPCGSGTSAILAARHAAGASDVGDELVNAGITGETFLARVEATTRIGDREGVITSVQGRAFVTGRHTFIRDERDPLADGFLLA